MTLTRTLTPITGIDIRIKATGMGTTRTTRTGNMRSISMRTMRAALGGESGRGLSAFSRSS